MKLLVLSAVLAVVAAGPPLAKSRMEIEEYRTALFKSMEDDGLTLEERMGDNPHAVEWESSGKYEGDMLLDEDLIEDLVNDYATGGRMAYIRQNRRWPHNTIVYEYGHNEFNIHQQRHITGTMHQLQRATCIRFRHRNGNDRHWVRVTGRGTGCYATVGWVSNRQISIMNVARNEIGRGCLNPIIIMHEWFHVAGFFHMQSTYNRYNYVRIHWENIRPGRAHNFYRHGSNMISNLRLPYEYGSCMHYGTHFFTANQRPTISTTRHYGGQLGQRVRVTGWDVWRLARHYNCPGAWSDEALQKARITAYEQDEEGHLVEKEVEPQPLADELDPIDLEEQIDYV